MESLTDQLLPVSREVLKNVKIKEARSGQQGIWHKSSIIDIYEQYVTTFPITVDQAGLRTAIAIYSSEDGRKLILELLFDILKKVDLMDKDDCDSMIDTILDDKDGDITAHYEEFLIQSAIALKRAIRTFPLTKS